MADRETNPQSAAPSGEVAKRKGEAVPPSTPKRPKKVRAPPALVTLKNGRLTLRQKAVGWDRTMPVLRVSNRTLLTILWRCWTPCPQTICQPSRASPRKGTWNDLPSDKNTPELAKWIRATLLPEGHRALGQVHDGQVVDVLPISVLQTAIQAIATRTNYGISAPDDASLPPTLQLWRWEVADLALLPKENLDKLLARRDERVKAQAEAHALFAALPTEAQQAYLKGKKGKPAPPEPERAPSPPAAPEPNEEVCPPTTPLSKEKSERVKLRENKKAERQAKDEKTEKGKQAQARLFNSFFQPTSTRSPVAKDETSDKTDFQRTFLPCEYKNVAVTNRFYHPVGDALLEAMDTSASTQPLLAELKQLGKKRPRQVRRGIQPAVSVRDIMRTVQESDVLGGDAEERAKRELAKLSNRRLLPIKLLQFQSDRRPGWVGTWTRSSTFITPRRPFGQDPGVLDYTYDSDAEWDEVEEGENVDAMDEREDEESMGGSDNDDDSEMDDWLEDDLEEDDEVVAIEPESVPVPSVPDSPSAASAKPSVVTTLKPKKKAKLLGRRFDAKLIPYITGPHWESALGEPGHESFAPYRIQFLNDAYAGLDPFTFTSATVTLAPSSEEPMTTAESIPAATAAPPTRTTKFVFPDTHLPELLQYIQGSTRSKPALLEDLREHFAPKIKGVSKAALETRLQECAARESKKPGSKWLIKPAWQAYLPVP